VESKAWVLRGTVVLDRRGGTDLGELVKSEVARITDSKNLTNRLLPQANKRGTLKWQFKCAMAYRCDCPVRMRGWLEDDTLSVYSWEVHNEHQPIGNKRGISVEAADFLTQSIVDKVKPMVAHRSLTAKPYGKNVSYETVRGFFANHKTKIEVGVFSNTKQSWKAWCEERPWHVDAALDEPLVLSFDLTDGHFHILITTSRMLSMVLEQRRFQLPYKQADTTWKISWEGNPLIVTGTTDWKMRFLPTSFMLADHERAEEYGIAESKVAKALVEIAVKYEYDVSTAEAVPICCGDSAPAIKNGEVEAWGDEHTVDDELTCYFHMKNGVEGNVNAHLLASSTDLKEQLKVQLLNDLSYLHALPYGCTDAAFDAAVELWKDKWEFLLEQPGMVSWFEKAWLGRNKRWSRAHAPVGLPSVSNHLERHNRTIKDLLERIRSHAPKAIQDLARDVIGYWSEHRLPRELPEGPVDDEKMWLAVQV
jgi:hypothetical protein